MADPTTDLTNGIDFGRSVMVCSKPLQVLNCASIVRHFGIADSRLHVLTTSIEGVEEFRRFLSSSGYQDVFSSVSWNLDYADAIAEFTRQRVRHLVHRGRSCRSVPDLRTPSDGIAWSLFEEGIGTYRSSSEMSLRGLRKLKWKVLVVTTGCGWEFGEGRLTDVVAVSRPDVYRRLNPRTAHKAIGFPGIVDELRFEADAWEQLVLEQLGRPSERLGRVALVLAKWGSTPDAILDRALLDADIVFYKAHPHDGTPVERPDVVNLPGSWIPAEAVVGVLAGRSDHLTVFHHSSSVAFYLGGRLDGGRLRRSPRLGSTPSGQRGRSALTTEPPADVQPRRCSSATRPANTDSANRQSSTVSMSIARSRGSGTSRGSTSASVAPPIQKSAWAT